MCVCVYVCVCVWVTYVWLWNFPHVPRGHPHQNIPRCPLTPIWWRPNAEFYPFDVPFLLEYKNGSGTRFNKRCLPATLSFSRPPKGPLFPNGNPERWSWTTRIPVLRFYRRGRFLKQSRICWLKFGQKMKFLFRPLPCFSGFKHLWMRGLPQLKSLGNINKMFCKTTCQRTVEKKDPAN